ncbi:myelin-oligodendrocyte glycoprotein-like [Pempheris klunzingeri]|uniref:myelin-oligodendrocyte glycoprotein-like n=1 Tax=Pempheris klunzingeri TaxID=3127111 RepID=UPI0039801476
MDLEQLDYGLSLPPVILCVTCLLVFLSPVEGQPQVIGSLQPITASPGDDIILPCRVDPPLDVARLTVEWSKPDLQPDPDDRLSRVDYVHLYRDRREVVDMKISSYMRRTTLSTSGLRRGIISLKILNVTLADAGRYKCFIPKLKSPVPFSIVHLVIESNVSKTWTTETPLQTISLQTPDSRDETDTKGSWSSLSRLIPVVLPCVVLGILAVAVVAYLILKCPKRGLIKVPTV